MGDGSIAGKRCDFRWNRVELASLSVGKELVAMSMQSVGKHVKSPLVTCHTEAATINDCQRLRGVCVCAVGGV